MKSLIATIALLIAMNANAGIDIKHDEFVFKLGGDWVAVPATDKDYDFPEFSSNHFAAGELHINISPRSTAFISALIH